MTQDTLQLLKDCLTAFNQIPNTRIIGADTNTYALASKLTALITEQEAATPEQKAIEAVRAYINGDNDNKYLRELKIPADSIELNDILLILNHFVPCSK